MQRRFQTAALVAVVAALSVLVSSCGYMDTLAGRKAVKEAYALYQQQDYKRAAERF